MKKIVIGIVMFAFSLSSVFAQVSREEAYERVQQVIDREWEKVEVFMCKSPLVEGEKIEVLGGEPVYVKASGWVFFVDEMPYANWGHDCFYAFVDKETGRVDTLRRMMPPVSFEGMEQLRRVVPLLTEEELAVYKRGRNAHVHGVPQHADVGDYHAATGLEALFGWLYLLGRLERIQQLYDAVTEG